MEILENSNVLELCRLCLRGNSDVSVFSENPELSSLPQKIFQCVSVQITVGDNLSSAICHECMGNVNLWVKFKDKCDQTQRTLSTWLKSQNLPISQENKESSTGLISSVDHEGMPKDDFGIEKSPVVEESGISKEKDGLKETSKEVSGEIIVETSELPSNVCLAAKVSSSGVEDETLCDVSPMDSSETPSSSEQVVKLPSDQGVTSSKELLPLPKTSLLENALLVTQSKNHSLETIDLTENIQVAERCENSSSVSIKIESTHSVPIDVFNNYNTEDVIECDEEGGREGKKKDKPTAVSSTGDSSIDVDKISPSEVSQTCEKQPEPFEVNSSNIIIPEVILAEPSNKDSCSTSNGEKTISVPLDIRTSEESPFYTMLPVKTEFLSEPEMDEEEECNTTTGGIRVKAELMECSNFGENEDNSSSINPNINKECGGAMCNVCNRWYSSRPTLLRHYKSKLHRKYMSLSRHGRRMLPHPVVPRRPPPSRQPRIKEYSPEISKVVPNIMVRRSSAVFQCKPCNSAYKTRFDRDRHYLSLKHRMNIATKESISDTSVISQNSMFSVGGQHGSESENIFACPVEQCPLKFSSGLLLICHMKAHGIVSNMSKELISSNFTNTPIEVEEPEVERKERRIKKEKRLDCPHCGMYFSSSVGISNHLRFCTGNMKPPLKNTSVNSRATSFQNISKSKFCNICQIKFRSEIEYMNHIERNHTGSPLHKALILAKRAVKRPTIVSKVVQGGVYKCKICFQSFRHSRLLNIHMRKHVKQVKPALPRHGMFVCKICRTTIGDIKNYRIHLKSHFVGESSKRSFFCISCFQLFDTRSDIAKHKSIGKCTPFKMKIYSCNICNHSYNNLSDLEEHKVEAHANTEDSDLQVSTTDFDQVSDDTSDAYCKLCDKTYSSRGNYLRHVKYAHRASTIEINCSTCGETFSNQDLFRVHKDICQLGINNSSDSESSKKFKCTHCPSEFTRKSNLNQHMLTTCPVLVYKRKKCVRCDKFVDQHLLDQDDCCLSCTTVHTDNGADKELFKCPLGERQFMSKISLMNHYSNCKGSCTNSMAIYCKSCKESYPDVQIYKNHKPTCGKGVVSSTSTNRPKSKYRRYQQTKYRRYPCSFCTRDFSRHSYVLEHENKVHYDEKHMTSFSPSVESQLSVDNSVESQSIDKSSLQESAPPDPIHVCKVCNAICKTRKYLEFHMKKYKGKCKEMGGFDKSYDCNICCKAKPYHVNLYHHVYSCIKRGKSSAYACPGPCQNTFYKRDGSKEFTTKIHQHILECLQVPFHASQNPEDLIEKVLCHHCNYAFISPDALKAHLNLEHYVGKPNKLEPLDIKEDISGFDISNQSMGDLEHDKVNSNEQSSVKNSLMEDSTVEDLSTMEDVKPSIADFDEKMNCDPNADIPRRRYPCPYCSRVFSLHKNLKAHKSSKHSNSKYKKVIKNRCLKCKVCSRQFVSFAKLKNHEKVHGIVRQNVYKDFGSEAENEQRVENVVLENVAEN